MSGDADGKLWLPTELLLLPWARAALLAMTIRLINWLAWILVCQSVRLNLRLQSRSGFQGEVRGCLKASFLRCLRFWDWAKCKNYRVLKAHDGVCTGCLWQAPESSLPGHGCVATWTFMWKMSGLMHFWTCSAFCREQYSLYMSWIRSLQGTRYSQKPSSWM